MKKNLEVSYKGYSSLATFQAASHISNTRELYHMKNKAIKEVMNYTGLYIYDNNNTKDQNRIIHLSYKLKVITKRNKIKYPFAFNIDSVDWEEIAEDFIMGYNNKENPTIAGDNNIRITYNA